MNQKNIIIALVALAVVGVLATKMVLKKPVESTFEKREDSPEPAVYLFLNEKDQDAGCRSIYSLFETQKGSLPPGIRTARLDVNGDQTLFKKFDVRILPAILFVDKKGEIKQKIEGEGAEVTEQIKEAFSNAKSILTP